MAEERLLGTIGELYEAATDPERLASIGGVICRAVGVDSTIVFAAQPVTGKMVRLVDSTPNFDANARADYRAYYHERNEWFQRVADRKPPFVNRGEELLDYRDFERTEFCSDWCSRVGIFHMIGGVVPIREGVIGACGVHASRKAGPFDDDKKRLFGIVMQHLGRALQIVDRIGVLVRAGEVTFDIIEGLDVGVMLVDETCRPLFVNGVAERLLKAARWFSFGGGQIRSMHPLSQQKFRARVAGAACASAGHSFSSGGVLALRDPIDGDLAVLIAPFRSVRLDFGPMQPAAVIVFSDPDARPGSSSDLIAATHGLTRAEGRLVASLVTGRSLVDFARDSGISINTAKTQLSSIFLKTGHNRQANLIAAVLAHPVGKLAQRAELSSAG